MTPRFAFPDSVLEQHLAVLGKTGSGKSSTSKLAIEQAVAGGARVCVLDPIKSDWWGLTSSADGRKAGLPFHILGGPHGHVPLHSSAGRAIAEVVASGALPLSIVDMADFEPGGQARFFVDFAQTLLRKMRGVVYLVLEEAHLFAPKERSGIGQENLAIHWAKTLATAGRSKGIRLVLVTQRTQALHNALLGSCDTVIAHRLTAPADQAPVVSWLKANTSKTVLEQVSSSLSSLKTGEGWICAGEARLFQRVHFPRIATYDNTATPTGQGEAHDVTTAAVDTEQLRTLIGAAVEQAKQDDPRELRKQLAAANAELSNLRKSASSIQAQEVHVPFVPDPVRAQVRDVLAAVERFNTEVREAVLRHGQDVERELGNLSGLLATIPRTEAQLAVTPAAVRAFGQRFEAAGRTTAPTATIPEPRGASSADTGAVRGGKFREMLVALAQAGRPLTDSQVAARAVMALSGTFDKYLSQQRAAGWVEGTRQSLTITDSGIAAISPFDPLPTGVDLQNHWLGELGQGKKADMLRVLIAAYPRALSDSDVAERAEMALSGTFDKYLSQLRRLQLVDGPRSALRASQELFS